MKYAALLRGINVGGNKLLPMAKLREMATDMGFDDPKTLLQSGNLVFGARTQAPAKLETLLEAATRQWFGFEVVYYVRSADEWAAVIAANPFPAMAKADPSHLLVKFEREAPPAEAVKLFRKSITGPEEVKVVGREWFVTYPDGIGKSTIGTTKEGRAYAKTGTARNWNTVLKIRDELLSS